MAQRKLDQLNGVVSLASLKIPPGNLLESLKDDREGQHSIRINDQFRVCFVWTDDGAEDVLFFFAIVDTPMCLAIPAV